MQSEATSQSINRIGMVTRMVAESIALFIKGQIVRKIILFKTQTMQLFSHV